MYFNLCWQHTAFNPRASGIENSPWTVSLTHIGPCLIVSTTQPFHFLNHPTASPAASLAAYVTGKLAPRLCAKVSQTRHTRHA